MANIWDNPMGTDGFEFVEYTAPDVAAAARLFERMGFRAVARHRSKDVTLLPPGRRELHRQCRARQPWQPLRQGARAVGLRHGVPREGCGRRPTSALIALGAKPFENQVGPMELNIPAIEGIGGSVIYLVDRYGDRSRSTTSISCRPIRRRAMRMKARA